MMSISKLILGTLFLSIPCLVNAQYLDNYLKEAAENNPGLKAFYSEFEAALQRIPQAKALPDPNFSFGYFVSSVETRVGPQQARFSLSQKFPWFGTLAAKGEAATLTAEAEYQEFLNAKNELYYKVKAAWYPLYEVNRIVHLQKKNRDILLTYKRLSTAAFKNGKGSMTDVIRIEIMIDNADTEINILGDKKKPLLTHFNTQLNRPDTIHVLFPDSLLISKIPEDYRKDSLLTANPMLEAFDMKIQAAKAQEKVARKNGLPKLGLGADYVIVGNRTDINISDNGKDVFMPMVSMSLPFYRGKYKAAVKEAQFLQSAVASSKENYKNNLISTYEMTRYELDRARQLVELYAVQTEKTEQAVRLLLTAYSNSGKDFEEVLRMQQELLNYQIAETRALKEFYIALAKLDYLTAKSE